MKSKYSKRKSMKKPDTTYVAIDVLQWEQTKREVTSGERPVNVLNKKPHEHDAQTLEDLVLGFLNDPIGKLTLKNINKQTKTLLKKGNNNYDKLPNYQKIPLRNLLSALAVQRPLSYKHLKKILEKWDDKKVQYVNVLKIKYDGVYYYYVIDGQHTAVCYGVQAFRGYYDVADWLDVGVKCQVVEFNNFTFAREHFLGINGGDKLKLAHFDKWKNWVLAKRQDSPNATTLDTYEDAYAQQVIMESYGIIPRHEGNEEDNGKPGSFTRTDLLKDINEDELHWWCRVHQINFDDREVDSMEVMPIVNLYSKIKGEKSLNNNEVYEFVVALGNIIKNVAGSPAQFRVLTSNTYKDWYKESYPEERKVPSTPGDAELALMLQIYYEAGGEFNRLSKRFLDDYEESGYKLFHALDQNLQDMIKKVK